jgi:thiamine-phosphate pyrophosphorylase
VVLSPQAGGDALDRTAAKAFVDIAQRLSIATLIETDAPLARDLGADGVHLPWGRECAAAYAAAREVLGTSSIVGADAGRSRHDAMTLGELGADYIAFGIPPHVAGRETAIARRLDLVQWWAEIFEVPVVAFDVETPGEAEDLAAIGVDFIAVRVPDAASGHDIESWAGSYAAAIRAWKVTT